MVTKITEVHTLGNKVNDITIETNVATVTKVTEIIVVTIDKQ